MFTYPLIVAPLDKRLDSTDATFVQVIHTAAKTLGTQMCMGDDDFWANGGEMQPGCFDSIESIFESKLCVCDKFQLAFEKYNKNRFVLQRRAIFLQSLSGGRILLVCT